jgi:hypothetical protein
MEQSELQSNTRDAASLYPPSVRPELIRCGPWSVLVSRNTIEMNAYEHERLLRRLHEWREIFPKYPKNLAQEAYRVPSVLVRVDYFCSEQFGPRLCEIEERPAGIFVTAEINRRFRGLLRESFDAISADLGKPLAIVISEGRKGTSDDEEWANVLLKKPVPVFHGLPDPALHDNYLWWVRSRRHEEAYYPLREHALSTIALEGNKEYGVTMGLWHPINHISDIPFDSGCVLKPKAGSRFETIIITKTDTELRGTDTLRKAKDAIKEGKVAYWQQFFWPERPKMLNPNIREHDIYMLRRVFFALDPSSREFTCLGGLWMANPTVRIHGGPESLCGPIYPPK